MLNRSALCVAFVALCVLLCTSSAALAQAEETTPEEDVERTLVAVLFLATGPVDETLAENLTEVLLSTVAARGQYAIVGREQFSAAMGFGGEEQTMACAEDPVCLGRIGTLVGAEEVILGALGQRGGRYLVSLSRIDVRRAHAVHRIFRSTPAEVMPLIEAVRTSAEELMAPPPGSLRVTVNVEDAVIQVDGEVQEPDPDGIIRGLEPGTHELLVEAEGHAEVAREFNVERGVTAELAVSLSPIGAAAPTPWYRRWWVWTIVGVAVAGAGAATTAVLLTQDDPPEVSGTLGAVTYPTGQ